MRGRERSAERICPPGARCDGNALIIGAALSGCGYYYEHLLLTEIRLTPADDLYARPIEHNPDGKSGVSTTFADGHLSIVDTILIYSDDALATAALNDAKAGFARLGGAPPQAVAEIHCSLMPASSRIGKFSRFRSSAFFGDRRTQTPRRDGSASPEGNAPRQSRA